MRKKIKLFLGRFLPVPARTFNARIETMADSLANNFNAKMEVMTDSLANTFTAKMEAMAESHAKDTENTRALIRDLNESIRQLRKVTDASQNLTDSTLKTVSDIQKSSNAIQENLTKTHKISGEVKQVITEVLWKKASATQDIANDMKKTVSDIQRSANRSVSENEKLHQRTQGVLVNTLAKTWKRSIMEHLDFHLAEHCNLNCKGCSTFSPIAPHKYADPKAFEVDLAQLHTLVGGNIRQIHLLGGEPLLHPQAEQFALIARSIFQDARIDFTTNGLLIKTMSDSFFGVLRDHNIAIKYTRYPIDFDYDHMVEFLQDKGISVFSAGGKIAYFRRIPLNTKGTLNMYKSYTQCPYIDCPQLRDGRLYRCPASAFCDILNDKLRETSQTGSFHIHESDYIDIYSVKSRSEIEAFLSSPISFCQYCDLDRMDSRVPWSSSSKDIQEWVDI